jgi:hypothetical protein
MPDPAEGADAVAMLLTELHALARSGNFEAALAAAETVEGTDAERIEARCVQAWCLSRLGDQPAALMEAAATLAEAETTLGPTHHVTLEALNDVARFSARCGDLPAAISHGESVHARRVELLGEHHPKTLTSLTNLLNYRATLGEAVPASEIAALKAWWRVADPEVVDPAHLNAWVLWAELTGDASSASTCLVRFTDILGEDHPDTLRARDRIAALVARSVDQT